MMILSRPVQGFEQGMRESTVALNSDLAFVSEGLHSEEGCDH